MKITISELRQIIRDTIKECYGWPVAQEKPLYNVKGNIGAPSPHDPKNSALRYPRGKNSRSTVNESFSRITSKELDQWRSGNWGYIQEANEDEDENNECSECGSMKNECDC